MTGFEVKARKLNVGQETARIAHTWRSSEETMDSLVFPYGKAALPKLQADLHCRENSDRLGRKSGPTSVLPEMHLLRQSSDRGI